MNAQSLAQVIELNQYNPSRIGGNIKGLKSMTAPSKKISLHDYVYNLVDNYSKYNPEISQYDLELHELPDFIRHEFAAQIMSDKPMLDGEANGPDNPAYEKSMMPALLNYLKNSHDKDAEIIFTSAWREGVTSYFKNEMTDLLNDMLSEYNSD